MTPNFDNFSEYCSALITGASSGVGRAMSVELARVGAKHLFLAGLGLEGLKETEVLCKQASSLKDIEINLFDGDLCSDQVLTTISDAVTSLGKLDVLILCAGIGYNGKAKDVTREELDRVMNINFRSPTLLFNKVFPALVAAGGAVGVVTSVQAHIPAPLRAPYSASKAAISQYFNSVRLESPGISITELLPSHVATAFRAAAAGAGQSRGQAKQAMTAEELAPIFVNAVLQRRRSCTRRILYAIYCPLYGIIPGVIDYFARKMYKMK